LCRPEHNDRPGWSRFIDSAPYENCTHPPGPENDHAEQDTCKYPQKPSSRSSHS